VGIGDTTYRVLTACGVPDYREVRITEKVGGRRSHTWRTKTVTVKGGHKYEGISSGDELWYYDLGPSQFVYQIEFSRSKVNAIRKQGTGTTEGIADWGERRRLAR
jgi:hypothetical protein